MKMIEVLEEEINIYLNKNQGKDKKWEKLRNLLEIEKEKTEGSE